MKKVHLFVERNISTIIILFGLFTVGMLLNKGAFYISEEVSHPQFLGNEIWNNMKIIDIETDFIPGMNTIYSSGKLGYFQAFFSMDIFWPFLLLLINYYLASIIFNRGILLRGLLILSIFALASDYLENYTYLSAHPAILPFLGWIIASKMMLFYTSFTWTFFNGLKFAFRKIMIG